MRVFVVEDNEDIREPMVELLADCGHDVSGARDGVDALEMLAALPTPDVMLIDLMMPRMSGEELIVRLRTDVRLATVPRVVLSASRLNHRPDGADAVLCKPVDLDVLLSTIEAIARGGHTVSQDLTTPMGHDTPVPPRPQ